MATEPTTVVTAVHPSADVVPANLLRVYIEFSAPMGNGAGLDFVKLVELSGPGDVVDGVGNVRGAERVEPGAFLPVEANFWSPDHTRYTLFFDPGRVKEGILPNRQSGRPLRAGRRYALDIASAWADANGLPLKAAYRHVFRVGPAVDEPINVSDWTMAVPQPAREAPSSSSFRARSIMAFSCEPSASRPASEGRLQEKCSSATTTRPGYSPRSRRGRAASTIWWRSRFSRIRRGIRSAVPSKHTPTN